jgi:hypothetical protein
VAHHDDRDLFLVDRAQHRGGSCGQHPRPQPDRVVYLRHHLFAFAQRLVAVSAAQPSELLAAGRMYMEGELRELEERRRRRAIIARIAAVVVVLMGIVAWMMLA